MGLGPLSYLHPKESDAGEKVHSGFEVLESLWAACWVVNGAEGRVARSLCDGMNPRSILGVLGHEKLDPQGCLQEM